MLAANVCSAEFIASLKHSSLFRVHEGQRPRRRRCCRATSRPWAWGCRSATIRRPASSRRLPKRRPIVPDAMQIHSMLLRSMQQAIYTPINSGHFGLAYRPTRTSRARFAATRTCWCTASSRPCCSARNTTCRSPNWRARRCIPARSGLRPLPRRMANRVSSKPPRCRPGKMAGSHWQRQRAPGR